MALKPHSFWSWKIRKVLWGEDASVIQLFFNLQVIKNIYLVAVLKVYHVQMMNCTSSCGRTQSHRDLNFICYNFVVEPHFNLTWKGWFGIPEKQISWFSGSTIKNSRHHGACKEILAYRSLMNVTMKSRKSRSYAIYCSIYPFW